MYNIYASALEDNYCCNYSLRSLVLTQCNWWTHTYKGYLELYQMIQFCSNENSDNQRSDRFYHLDHPWRVLLDFFFCNKFLQNQQQDPTIFPIFLMQQLFKKNKKNNNVGDQAERCTIMKTELSLQTQAAFPNPSLNQPISSVNLCQFTPFMILLVYFNLKYFK